METFKMRYNVKVIEFVDNTANGSGPVLHGGLLDRCTLVPGAEICLGGIGLQYKTFHTY